MKTIERVAIIGAGTMGRRIAFGCVLGQIETTFLNNAPGVCEQAMNAVLGLIEERVATNRSSAILESAAKLLSHASSLGFCAAGADLVIERVRENVELKHRVFAEIDTQADARALIGTNTSSIPDRGWRTPPSARKGLQP